MATTWINRGHLYAPHVTPVIADCSFVVTPTNSLGITSLTGQAAQNVFMHTSTTPGHGRNNVLNPNPAAGVIVVQLADNFTRLYSVQATLTSPASGSDVAIDASDALLSVGTLYVITTLGTSTAADWLAIGLPPGVTPAIGACLIAKATGAGTGTGKVQVPATAGSAIDHIELVGNPTTMLGPVPVGGSPNVGAWVMIRTMAKAVAGTAAAQTFTGAALGTHTHSIPAGTDSGGGTSGATSGGTPAGTLSTSALTATSTDVQTAPATGTVIRLCLYMNQSSVTVAGE